MLMGCGAVDCAPVFRWPLRLQQVSQPRLRRRVPDAALYAEAAKSAALCRQSGASVSRLVRECGVNAAQVSQFIWEHREA